MSDYRLYVIVRTTLHSMNPGKAQAHSGHAVCQFYKHVIMDKKHPMHKAGVAWADQADGFGTQINLQGLSDQDILEAYTRTVEGSIDTDIISGVTFDPTYPYFVDAEIYPFINADTHTLPAVRMSGQYMCFRNDWTAAWFFGTKEDLQPILTKFKLHP